MTLRVAMVCPYGLSHPGGVQQQALGLSRALGLLGVEVQLLAPDVGDETRQQLAPGLSVVCLGRTVRIPANGSQVPIAFPSAIWRTRQALRRFSPHVVHVHEPLVPGPSFGCYMKAVPVVATFHRAGAGISAVVARPLARRIAPKITKAVAVSETARTTAYRYFDDDLSEVAVLFNGVDLSRFGASPVTGEACTQVVFVGRHEPRKGLSVLLQAFSGLKQHVRLVVVGEGPETARLRKSVESDARVAFVGRLDDESLAKVLDSSAILCAPALSGESFGVVLLEAMAARTAVIASAIPGYVEAAADAALYVRPGDPLALRQALGELLSDATKRRALIEAGTGRVAKFSFEELARRYLSMYEDLAPAKSRRSSS